VDFFASQELARKKTKWLIIYFILAILSMILGIYAVVLLIFNFSASSAEDVSNIEFTLINLPLLVVTVIGVLSVVGGGSLFKVAELRSGGSSVANLLGGRLIPPNSRDLAERRILNVVEEMALASGTPVPPVYVLDKEPGINAFAAGYTADDAVIGINRGTIETLNRDELQGVVAHEFSHILNGDMRMSIRLIGILHGIQILALIGFFILRGSFFAGSRDNKGAGAIVAVALALVIFGSLGLFFARLIKASVSRQREYLADASAVQFTRNPDTIGGALKMIGASSAGSKLKTANAEIASHMYFADMFSRHLSGWLATHPPLINRIQKIDPHFQGDFENYLKSRATTGVLGRQKPEKPQPQEVVTAEVAEQFGGKFFPQMKDGRFPIDPLLVVASIGLPTREDVQYSQAAVENIPSEIRDAARDVFSARCLVFATLVDQSDRDLASKQLNLLREHENPGTVEDTLRLLPQVLTLPKNLRLPVFELVQGTLTNLSANQFQQFRLTVHSLIEADRRVDLFEFFLRHHLLVHLERHLGLGKKTTNKFKSLYVLQREVQTLLGLLTQVGHDETEQAAQAFQKSMDSLGQSAWGQGSVLQTLQFNDDSLRQALQKLSLATPQIKKQILMAAAVAITHDGQVTVEEAELFRAFSESLDCPVPPVVSGPVKRPPES